MYNIDTLMLKLLIELLMKMFQNFFFFVTDAKAKKARSFLPGKPFLSSLIIPCTAVAYPSGALFSPHIG